MIKLNNSRTCVPSLIVVPNQYAPKQFTQSEIFEQLGMKESDYEIALTVLQTVCATAVDSIFTFIGRIKASQTEEGQRKSGYLRNYCKKMKGAQSTFLSVLTATERETVKTNKSMCNCYKYAAETNNFSVEYYIQRFTDAMDEADEIMKPMLDAAHRLAFARFSSEKAVNDPWLMADLFACYINVKCMQDCYEGFSDVDAFHIIREINSYNHLCGRALRAQLDKIVRTVGFSDEEKAIFGSIFAQPEAHELYIDLLKVRCSSEYIDRILVARGDRDKQYRDMSQSFATMWNDKAETQSLDFYRSKYSKLYSLESFKAV